MKKISDEMELRQEKLNRFSWHYRVFSAATLGASVVILILKIASKVIG